MSEGSDRQAASGVLQPRSLEARAALPFPCRYPPVSPRRQSSHDASLNFGHVPLGEKRKRKKAAGFSLGLGRRSRLNWPVADPRCRDTPCVAQVLVSVSVFLSSLFEGAGWAIFKRV